MAVRTPLYLSAPAGDPQFQILEMDATTIQNVHNFAPYAYGNNSLGPSAKLEVNTANGTLMSNQPFVDTYYIAGAYTTRVDRFSTEAETPNISMVTDNYNRLRENYDVTSLPTGDTSNFQFPLVLWNTVTGYDIESGDDLNTHLRAMNRTDFIDTFVTPALTAIDNQDIWAATTNKEQQGTYFLTTSSSPANATLVSATPVAVNSVANISAYTSGGIPEAQKQTIDVNYYLAKVDYPPTAWTDLYDATFGYDLPLYFDAGTEQIRQHTPTTWANLLGPWLRYYLGNSGTGYNIVYSLSSGNQRGSTYTDTRVTPTGTGYTTLYVNTDDYRTQEFPTGTASTITANTKRFYIDRGGLPSYGASATPSGSVDEGQSVTFTLTTANVVDGTTFAYTITGIQAADISSGSLTGTVTINSNSGSTTITLVALDGVESETATCTFTTPGGNRVAAVTVNDVAELTQLEGTSVTPEVNNTPYPTNTDSTYAGGWEFRSDGTVYEWYVNEAPEVYSNTNHIDWCTQSPTATYYIRATIFDQDTVTAGTRVTAVTGASFNTWHALTSNRLFMLYHTASPGTYGESYMTFKIEIASDAAGANILSTGYYKHIYNGTPEAAQLEGPSSGSPELQSFPPPIPGANNIALGWRFSTDGKIYDWNNSNNQNTFSTTGHIPWNNKVQAGEIGYPTGDWYVRCTSRTGDGVIFGGWSLNTWYKISGSGSSNITFAITDTDTPGTYGPHSCLFTFQISRNNDGTNIADTGYYSLSWEGGA